MRKVGAAIAGVASSAAIAAGAWGVEVVSHDKQESATIECRKIGGPAVNSCIEEAKSLYNHDGSLGILELAGFVGIIGCGYLGYKAVKEEVGTTGILEDL